MSTANLYNLVHFLDCSVLLMRVSLPLSTEAGILCSSPVAFCYHEDFIIQRTNSTGQEYSVHSSFARGRSCILSLFPQGDTWDQSSQECSGVVSSHF